MRSHRDIAENALSFRSGWVCDLFHPILCLALKLTVL